MRTISRRRRRAVQIAAARVCYRIMLASGTRIMISHSEPPQEPFTMIFARGARAEELRRLLHGGISREQVEVSNGATGPQGVDELTARDQHALQSAAKSARRLMRKRDSLLLTITFADEAEPMLTVYARGPRAAELRRDAGALGLIAA